MFLSSSLNQRRKQKEMISDASNQFRALELFLFFRPSFSSTSSSRSFMPRASSKTECGKSKTHLPSSPPNQSHPSLHLRPTLFPSSNLPLPTRSTRRSPRSHATRRGRTCTPRPVHQSPRSRLISSRIVGVDGETRSSLIGSGFGSGHGGGWSVGFGEGIAIGGGGEWW